MKPLALVACLGAAVFVTGCMSIDATMRSWLGRTETELIAQRGKPATTESDGHGGRILTYYEYNETYANTDKETVDRANGLLPERAVVRGEAPREVPVTPFLPLRHSWQRNFWVDASGTIYSCSWQTAPGLSRDTPQMRSASLRSG